MRGEIKKTLFRQLGRRAMEVKPRWLIPGSRVSKWIQTRTKLARIASGPVFDLCSYRKSLELRELWDFEWPLAGRGSAQIGLPEMAHGLQNANHG
jgi:hypothetical protein